MRASFVMPSSFLAKRHHPGTLSMDGKRASLFVTLQQQSAVGGRADDSINFGKEDGNKEIDALTLCPNEIFKKLSSFSSNISRQRKAKKQLLSIDSKATKSSDQRKINDAIIGASQSLLYFLRDERKKLSSSKQEMKMDDKNAELLRENLEKTIIQSIRGTSEAGDFILLRKIMNEVVEYATAVSKAITSTSGSNLALLKPRIFGEAVSSLSKTKASTSKVKALWNFFIYDVAQQDPPILLHPPSSFELNAMLQGLVQRGKVGAVLDFYKKVVADNSLSLSGDAYTASILFELLAESTASQSGWSQNEEIMKLLTDTDDNQLSSDDSKSNLPIGASPCWQWNEAMALLESFTPDQLNNHAYAALMKVNEQATFTFQEARLRHNGVSSSMSVLERMKKDKISPDVVTCSTLMKTFDKGHHWKAAVSLLTAMQSSSEQSNGDSKQKSWSLPSPNSFIYSQAISTCARCNQGEAALSLLDQMATTRINSKEDPTISNAVEEPNTWVYNSAILACVQAKSTLEPKSEGIHMNIAFDILEKMENGKGSGAAPDTVSYNTALSAASESSFRALKDPHSQIIQLNSRISEHDEMGDLIADVLDTMEKDGIPRDSITYYNAIMAYKSSPEHALMIFRRALLDSEFVQIVESSNSSSKLRGRAADGIVFIANAALSIASSSGRMDSVAEILSLLLNSDSKINVESIRHIIRALGKIGDCEAILALLISLRGQTFANDMLKERYSVDILSNIDPKSIPVIEESVYSTAITTSLRSDELGIAGQVLLSMKKNGLTPNQQSLKEIILEYCRMAMNSSKEEFKVARMARRQGLGDPKNDIVEPSYITSRARAKAALTMLKAVENPPPSLLAPVAKACCSAGLWQDARSILRRMHRAAIQELRQDKMSSTASGEYPVEVKFLRELPRLHRSLLKFCAKGGNITPALNFADDIQFLATRIRRHGKHLRGVAAVDGNEAEYVALSSRLLMEISAEDVPETDFNEAGASSTMIDRPIGLTGQDWKLILIAASRGGHWKVCVGTLPFIRPYVKETHPKYALESLGVFSGGNQSRPSMERLNRKYERIARALTAAILCFESRSQYAWALRAIDDWIEWSGRRPRKEAVTSACRVLAKRFRGQEVINLVTKVLTIPSFNATAANSDIADASEYTYEKAVYTEAINALHKSGLYEEADQLYIEGVRSKNLPWAVMKSSDASDLMLDLHGMSAAVAHSAVRVSLQREIIETLEKSSVPKEIESNRNVVIITGRGRRSGEKLRPVLRPEVQRMLTEEFYPPLGTSSMPGNMGALLVASQDISAWVNHQRQQKGERLLFVADVLRDISSGSRLERALKKKLNPGD